jgi:hypothetical protein
MDFFAVIFVAAISEIYQQGYPQPLIVQWRRVVR